MAAAVVAEAAAVAGRSLGRRQRLFDSGRCDFGRRLGCRGVTNHWRWRWRHLVGVGARRPGDAVEPVQHDVAVVLQDQPHILGALGVGVPDGLVRRVEHDSCRPSAPRGARRPDRWCRSTTPHRRPSTAPGCRRPAGSACRPRCSTSAIAHVRASRPMRACHSRDCPFLKATSRRIGQTSFPRTPRR